MSRFAIIVCSAFIAVSAASSAIAMDDSVYISDVAPVLGSVPGFIVVHSSRMNKPVRMYAITQLVVLSARDVGESAAGESTAYTEFSFIGGNKLLVDAKALSFEQATELIEHAYGGEIGQITPDDDADMPLMVPAKPAPLAVP